MTEQTENIRRDSSTRDDKQQQKTDWSGRVLVLPKGTTLPSVNDSRIEGEVFIRVNEGSANQLFQFDGGLSRWVTVGS